MRPQKINRERIGESAMSLIRRFGREKVSLSDIARDLGVTHAAIYHHFKNKKEIEQELLLGWIQESKIRIETIVSNQKDPCRRIEDIFVSMHLGKKEKIKADPEIYKIYLAGVNEMPSFVVEYRMLALEAVKDAMLELSYDSSLIEESLKVLEDATLKFIHPLHTLEMIDQDTEKPLRKVIRAVVGYYRMREA